MNEVAECRSEGLKGYQGGTRAILGEDEITVLKHQGGVRVSYLAAIQQWMGAGQRKRPTLHPPHTCP